MAIALAKRMDTLRASDVREMLKVTERPGVISFAGGLPAPELFPTEALAEIAAELLRTDGARALQYSTTEGYRPLRERVASRMNAHWGTRVSAEEVLVTTGSQQGLDLSAKLFLDEGDTVFCESPTYLAAISAFKVFSPRFVEVPTDDEGMKIEALEQLLAAGGRPKLIYVVPNSQNPSGRTWTLERRVQFMELLGRHPVAVIEDNPYGEVRFEGEPLPALQSFDRAGSVVLLGTFSKVLSPGLRVGWVAARQPLLEKYVILKQATDLHTCIFSQMLVERYLERFDLDADLSRIRQFYRERRDAMVRALEHEMPAGVRFTRPSGGLFVWVELPANINARELLGRCLDQDVAFVPGGAFFPERSREDTLRLNFSNMPPDRVREGVRRLASVLRQMLAEREETGGAEGRPRGEAVAG